MLFIPAYRVGNSELSYVRVCTSQSVDIYSLSMVRRTYASFLTQVLYDGVANGPRPSRPAQIGREDPCGNGPVDGTFQQSGLASRPSEYLSNRAALNSVPTGLAIPRPAMSGAEP